MAATLTVNGSFAAHGQHPGKSIFTVTLTGVSYVTGGITLDFTKVMPRLSSITHLLNIDISSSLGHTCWFVKGATMAASRVQLFVGITEVTAATSLTLTLSCELTAGRSITDIPASGLVIG